MSYTLNYRGAKIDELLGQVDEQFIAEYNVALYADITAAIAAGKQVLLKKDNALYPYIGTDASSSYTFAMVDEAAILQLFTVSTASVWATVSKALQEELTFDAAPTDGSTNPVTSDGIYDAIEEAKAEAQEQSYDLLVTDTAQGSIATFPDGAADVPVKSLIAQITPLQSGTGDPSPSNIRPISGWTGANIVRSGYNLFNPATATANKRINNGAEINAIGYSHSDYIPVKAGETFYVLSGLASSVGEAVDVYDENKSFVQRFYSGTGNIGVIIPSNGAYLIVNYDTANQSNLCVGTSSTGYQSQKREPFAGLDTINIDWTDEAGTVYGGTLTYIGGGKYSLQATKTLVDAATKTWALFANGCGIALTGVADSEISSHYKTNTAAGTWEVLQDGEIRYKANALRIKDAAHQTDIATWNAYLAAQTAANTPVQIAYGLATLPDPIILDAEDVKTLLGDNNIFCDTGNVDVTYRADTALYIDKKLGQ